MEQFVLAPFSVNNSSMKKQTVVPKKELPIYQSEEKPTYQIESVKKDMKKDLFAEVDSLYERSLTSPRIKLSTSKF